jgi:hypothetical protein
MMASVPPWHDGPHPVESDDQPMRIEHHAKPERLDASTSAPTPPHSLDAEREVLAAVFGSPSAMSIIGPMLTPQDFYAERHQAIFAAFVAMTDRGIAIDPVTLTQALKDRGQWERVGEMRGISALLDRIGTVANLGHYCAIVCDKARLRRVIDAARHIDIAAHQDVDDVNAFVAHADLSFGAAMSSARMKATIDVRSMHDAGDAVWLTETPPPADPLMTWPDDRRASLLIASGRVGLLAAAGGTGKSFALVQLAFAIATGTTWLGRYHAARKGRVLLALAEEDIDEIRRRMWAAARVFGHGEEASYMLAEAARNIVPLPLMGQDVALLSRDGGPTAWHRTIVERLSAGGPWRAIILDPLSRWGGPDIETDAHAATRVIQLLEELTKLEGKPAVIVAHHTNKGALNDDGATRTQAVVRGHSALVDGARWVGFLESVRVADKNTNRSRLRLSVVKSNYGPKPEPLELKRAHGGTLEAMDWRELQLEREEREQSRVQRRAPSTTTTGAT